MYTEAASVVKKDRRLHSSFLCICFSSLSVFFFYHVPPRTKEKLQVPTKGTANLYLFCNGKKPLGHNTNEEMESGSQRKKMDTRIKRNQSLNNYLKASHQHQAPQLWVLSAHRFLWRSPLQPVLAHLADLCSE